MKNFRYLTLVFICLFAAGGTIVNAASVDEILRQPFGSGGLSPGMTKGQVIQRYGEPDFKGDVISSDWKEPREEWFYKARLDILPVNAGYLSDDLYLYFDGDRLTNITHKPMGRSEQEGTEDGEKSFK